MINLHFYDKIDAMKELFTPKIRILWAVLGALSLIYALIIFLVHSGTYSFIMWVFGAVFFFICFILSGNGRWKRIPKKLRVTAYLLICAGIIVFISTQIAILSHFNDKGAKNLDYIIVLGSQMRESGPSTIYKFRLDKAKEYLDENPDTICITTGKKAANEPVSEGEGGKDYLISLGVPEERIIAETDSVDTVRNIENSMDIIRKTDDDADLKIGILTSNFHVFRGTRIAKKASDADIYGISAYVIPRYLPNNMLRECFGILRDLLTGKL